jgi:hypothetical protein
MATRFRFRNIIFIGALYFLLFGSCGGDTGPVPGNSDVAAPVVVAGIVDGIPIVEWNSVTDADSYDVYRSEDDGEFEFIGNVDDREQFVDSDGLQDKDLSYAVVTLSGAKRSPLSAPTGVIFVNVQNVYAEKFNSVNSIEVSWDKHEQADSYTLKRFDSASQAEVDATTIIENHSPPSSLLTVVYEDSTADPEKTYWYRVYWNENSTVHGSNSNLEFGICSIDSDYNEPENNDYQSLLVLIDPTDATAAGVGTAIQNYLYSVNDQAGGRVDDVDWFGMEAPENTAYTIEIIFDSGDLHQFDIANEIKVYAKYGTYYQLKTGSVVGNTYQYVLEQDVIDVNVPIYFQIIPTVSSAEDVYGSYTVQIKNGF